MSSQSRLYRLFYLFVLPFVFIVTACAQPNEPVSLNPHPELPSSEMGMNREVGLTVNDARTDEYRVVESATRLEPIPISDSEVIRVYQNLLVDGLQNHQFQPTLNQTDVSRKMTVEILEMNLTMDRGYFVDGIYAESRIRVTVTREDGQIVSTYRVKREEPYVGKFSTRFRQTVLNQTVSSVLTKLLNDRHLLTFLGEDQKGKNSEI